MDKPTSKPVYFGIDDAELYEHAQKIPNFSEWVKQKITNEIEQKKTGADPALVQLINDIVDKKLAGRVAVVPVAKENVVDAVNGMF